ncbi:MAG: AlpA family phage regulatory protein [Candidatus Nanopelagicales bacterium]|nr:AlpA family phage regulatory protein [Candidatus Nanopelagicales bacterium]
MSRPYVYTLIRDHGFPAPIKVGSKLAWSESEVSAWIEARAEARSNG